MKEFLKVSLVFAFCVRYAASIRCFECNSQNNSMCLDPTIYDKETLNNFLPIAECGHGVYSSHSDFFCRKIVQTILHKGYEPEVRVTRSCGWVRHHRPCYKADNEDHLETVCQCFEDECNAASTVHGAVLLVATVVGVVGLVRVTRSCGWVRHHRPCYKADNEDHLETVCQCFENECNAASRVHGAVLLVATVVGVMGL